MKSSKLRNRADFVYLLKTGKFIRHELFNIRYLINDKGQLRSAASASKKNYKKAVLRNFAKRRLREILRMFYPQLPIDILVSATNKTTGIPFGVLKDEFIKVMSQIVNQTLSNNNFPIFKTMLSV